jgi:hypothetical protein
VGISCCPLVHVAPKLDRKRLSKVVTAYLRLTSLMSSRISKPAKCSRGRLEGKGLKRMTAEIPVRRTCRNPHEFPHSMPHRRRVLVSFDGNVFSLDITCVVRFTSSSITALVVFLCARGSDLTLPAGAWLNTEVRSHQDQRQEAKVKSEGKKNIILKCGPWRKTREKREYNVAEIITVLEIEEQ